MGGGGGNFNWPSKTSPNDFLRRTTSETQRSTYQSELNNYLQDLLADYNNRNVEAIQKHLDTIANAISKDIEEEISLVYGGSVKKHTYVDGLSDVDILAIINNTALRDSSPNEVIEYFADKLKERLPLTEIKTGNLAITVRFVDGHIIQVLPALSTKMGVRIASGNENKWSNVVRPDVFAKKLTEVNQQNGNKVVRVIKLYKAINDQMPKDVKLSGYHIESLAINAFKNYQGKQNYKDMLMHFSDYASQNALHPIKDSTGQSIHVDDYLGSTQSYMRLKASASIKRILSRMKMADSAASVERWKELMGE
jgi:hypothetical protein